MMILKTKKDQEIMVDDCDYPLLSLIKWHTAKDRKNIYAQNANFGRLHNIIMPVSKPLEVDHIDGNGLNNQKSNLRVCTHSQNNINKKKKDGCSSKYIGVSWFSAKKKWCVRFRVNGEMTHFGMFVDETEAAKTRDKFARMYQGEFARLNFKE